MGKPRSIEWPDKARICVTFIVPWEVWPDNFGTHESTQRTAGHHIPPPNAPFKKSLSAVTEREYGDRAGIWRLLELFQRYQLKVTFLMNGLKVEQFPDIVKEIQGQGHEFSSEGYVHEYSFMYTKDEERESIHKTIKAFEEVLGEKPYGYLSPGHCHTDNTLDLISNAGYVWWADPLNDDVPYTVSANGRKLVVIPYNIAGCHDYSTYGTARTPRDLLQIWKDQFDYLYMEGERGFPKFFSINLHPFVSGVPYRSKVTDEFLQYIKGFPKVWFARRIEIANWWLEKGY
ncbi:MAG: polysaccharide deacetylase family protein [Deltaproteobacteria bacterium]|nr:polysaccharide deacetylase family protein [Deltaproteobacteria bacterium]